MMKGIIIKINKKLKRKPHFNTRQIDEGKEEVIMATPQNSEYKHTQYYACL
jgi:hypothetical protein